MMHIQRNMWHLATEYLKQFPVLAIIGARQVGKTTFSKQLCPDWAYFDIERSEHFEMISRDPGFFLQQYSKNVIIDEAQEYPELFRELRGVIDSNRALKGRYILTGSSSPELTKHFSESLAGRIGVIRLDTLKANEYYEKPLSKFYDLFKTRITDRFAISKPLLTNEQMRHCWLYGGFPEPMLTGDPVFSRRWMQNYQDSYINRDVAKLFPRLNSRAYQRFLSTLSQLSGTIINKSDLGRAIEISEGSIREYLQIAEGTFLWRSILSLSHSTLKSMVKRPKGHMCDSGLLHHLLKIADMESLLVSPKVGHSFEGFVIEEILKGMNAADITNYDSMFYRTYNGAEIDLVLRGTFGILPIEIKMGTKIQARQLTALKTFIDENNLPLGLVVNQSEEPTWLSNKIMQVPVGCL